MKLEMAVAFYPYKNYVLVCALVQLSFLPIESHGETVTVELLGNNIFSPREVVIQQGDTVLWDWKGGSHNVTSGTGSADPQSGVLFRSGNPTTAPFFFSVTFDDMGVFPYYCVPHEFADMKGTVTVEAASSVEGEGSQSTEGQGDGEIEGSTIICAPGHGDMPFGGSAGIPGDVLMVLLAAGTIVFRGSRLVKRAT